MTHTTWISSQKSAKQQGQSHVAVAVIVQVHEVFRLGEEDKQKYFYGNMTGQVATNAAALCCQAAARVASFCWPPLWTF